MTTVASSDSETPELNALVATASSLEPLKRLNTPAEALHATIPMDKTSF